MGVSSAHELRALRQRAKASGKALPAPRFVGPRLQPPAGASFDARVGTYVIPFFGRSASKSLARWVLQPVGSAGWADTFDPVPLQPLRLMLCRLRCICGQEDSARPCCSRPSTRTVCRIAEHSHPLHPGYACLLQHCHANLGIVCVRAVAAAHLSGHLLLWPRF